jgi:hypothetical protein
MSEVSANNFTTVCRMCVDVLHSNGNIAIEEEIVSHHGVRCYTNFPIKKLTAFV